MYFITFMYIITYVCIRPGRHCRSCTATRMAQRRLSSHNRHIQRTWMKQGHISEELGRLHVDICLQQMKSSCGFATRSGHYRLLGLLSLSRRYGLAFAVATHLEERIVRYWSLCHRIAVTQLHLTSALVNDNTVSCLQKI